jgi:hypothetical protein
MRSKKEPPPDLEGRGGALPQKQFAKKYSVAQSTIWRAVKAGRLSYIMIGRRKFILPPPDTAGHSWIIPNMILSISA